MSTLWKNFHPNWKLETHTKFIHTFDKPHSCDLCHKTFVDMHGLRSHTLVYTQESIYLCEICEKSLSYLSSLKNHKLVHSGEKSHICSVCPSKFTDKSSLIKHMCRIADSYKARTTFPLHQLHKSIHDTRRRDKPQRQKNRVERDHTNAKVVIRHS